MTPLNLLTSPEWPPSISSLRLDDPPQSPHFAKTHRTPERTTKTDQVWSCSECINFVTEKEDKTCFYGCRYDRMLHRIIVSHAITCHILHVICEMLMLILGTWWSTFVFMSMLKSKCLWVKMAMDIFSWEPALWTLNSQERVMWMLRSKNTHCQFHLWSVTFGPRHENKSCSACPKDHF